MNNTAIVINRLSEIDEPTMRALSELLIDVVDDGASIGFLAPLPAAASAAYWSQVLDEGTLLWTAMIDGQLAGTAQLHLATQANAAHRAEVAKLMVHPAFRRQSVGEKLMRVAEEAAKLEGRSLIVLDTRAGDPSNLLYKKMGYIEAGQIPGYARSSNGSLDGTVIYYKPLRAQ
jgi:ribosomal protein S18 acetylase RimI-like enzyme